MTQADEYWRDLVGFWRLWLTHLGRRFGILRLLAKQRRGIGVEEASGSLSLNTEALRAWFEAAHALGIVQKTRSGYRLPDQAAKLLVDEDHPDFMGGLLSYYALRSLEFQGFDALFGDRDSGRPNLLAQAFEEGTKWDHIAFTKLLLPRLPALRRKFEDGSAVLDLGCGSGGWIARLAPMFPKTMFIGIDPDSQAVERAKKRCLGMANTRFLVGRAEDLGYQHSFDIIYLGEVLYVINDKEGVLRACHRALRPGGTLVVCEALLDDEQADKVGRAIVRATALEYMLQGAKPLERKQLVELLRRAGFRRPRGHFLPGGLWFYLAKKQ